MIYDTIFSWITSQEEAYKQDVEVIDGYFWSMWKHIRLSVLYKNSQFDQDNENRDDRPFKNIVRPILNLQYRTEGFDVKDIEIYVNDSQDYYKSFLVKKFHEKWALQNELDTFIDELVESYVDFGGVLVKNVQGVRPEVVNLQSIAFCDQTDILSGPFAIKHYFTPQGLKKMKGWGEPSNGATITVDELITISEANKKKERDELAYQSPGNYIEIYEVHGEMSESWLDYESSNEKYVNQIQIVGFYKDEKGIKQGVCLFKKKEPILPFKFLARDKVYGRALGFGGVEELFEAQVWTNWNEINVVGMMEQAAKTLYKTTDPNFKNRNKLIDADNGEILTLQEGKDINQLDTFPRNLVVFTNAIREWEDHAQRVGAAGEALLGESPSSGTPFKLQELVTQEAKGLHHYRQGKIAVFVDEIYRDWIIPYIKREIVKDQEFLTELSVDELQSVVETLTENKANELIKENILEGNLVTQEDVELFKEESRVRFLRTNKKFIKILKGEFNDKELDVFTNIKGKQKNLALMTDKIVNLVRQFMATPQLREDPEMGKLLNTILESSGLSPMIFGATPRTRTTAQPNNSTEPLKALGESAKEAAVL